jgi:cytochrome P450
MVSAHHSWDTSIHPNAVKFDGYRFLPLCDQGSTTAQFATTSPSTIGFGHGHLACPGRFFAGDEIRIALSHILLKYDFEPVPGTEHKVNPLGLITPADVNACIMVRRRNEEIHI